MGVFAIFGAVTRAKMEHLTKAPARQRKMRKQSHREHGTDGPLSPANFEVLDPVTRKLGI